MSLSDEKLAEMRARHEAATRGPWRWFGSGGRRRKEVNLYLATTHSGRRYVMDFIRSGMGGAQPRFQPGAYRGMVPARDLLQYAVEYRDDITGIDCADARFIESSWSDVADLLDEVTRLRAQLAERENAEGSR